VRKAQSFKHDPLRHAATRIELPMCPSRTSRSIVVR
jgi:hypothetical protein